MFNAQRRLTAIVLQGNSREAGCNCLSRWRLPTNTGLCLQEPAQLQKLFEKNYDLLLSIFNPQVGPCSM